MKRLALITSFLTGLLALSSAAQPNSVTIDAAWLAANGPAGGPWLLTQSGTYTLATDVAALDTAFVDAAAGVTLDLAGHTITYEMRALPPLANGDFSNGLTGWDVSGAPGAIAQPPRTGMPGGGQCHVEGFAAPITIVSPAYPIGAINREYIGTVTLKGSPWNVSASLAVVDTVTGLTLASATSNQTGRGFALQKAFTPSAANPIQLSITITPPAGATEAIDIGYAQVLPSRDYGVVASPTPFAFPEQLKSYTAAKNANGFTLQGPGRIVQAGRGLGSHSVYVQSLSGGVIDQVDITAAGMDCCAVYGGYTKGLSVTRSTFRSSVPWISNRMLIFAALNFPKPQGALTIDGNTLLDCPQCGVAAYMQAAGFTTTITNNLIRQNALVSDPYGIVVYGLPGPTIAGNLVVPANGRGILIDGDSGGVTSNGDVHDNYVSVQERPNLEYPASGIEATALRLRNFPAKAGAQTGCNVHDNTFVATTGPGLAWCAIGARVSQHNDMLPIGQEAGANNLLTDNTFKALVNGTDQSQRAVALSLSAIDAGTGLQCNRNVLTGNDVLLAVGDNDSWASGETDVGLDNNWLLSRSDGGRTATPIAPHFIGAPGAIANIRVTNWGNGNDPVLSAWMTANKVVLQAAGIVVTP